MADIDRDKLKALASDPSESSESISEKLGLGKAHNLHYHLKKDPELKRIYNEGREVAGKGRKTSATKPRKSSKKTSAPPRKSSAKPVASKETLLKISLELDHIAIYGDTSQHFDELRDEVAGLIG